MKEYMPEETVDTLTKRLSDLTNSVSLPDTVKDKFSFSKIYFITNID